MKRLLISIFFSLFCNPLFSMDADVLLQTTSTEGPSITIRYLPAIPRLLEEEAATRVRSPKEVESKDLEQEASDPFQKLAGNFPLDRAINRIKAIKNAQVVLWFTNYFGKVSKKSLQWYKENILDTSPQSTFWLTDLYAWNYLSAWASELRGPMAERLKKGEQLPANECPMLSQSSNIFVENDVSITANYKLLSSKAFFRWLLTVKDTALVSDDTCNKLCRDTPYNNVIACSLNNLGYRPTLLNRTVERYKGKNASNLLTVENSLMYPVLQYLEGIYYAFFIIESNLELLEAGEAVSIVLLLPNREYIWFAVPQDNNDWFARFLQGVQRAIAQYGSRIRGSITIYLEPFAYGTSSGDAPYKIPGATIGTNIGLIAALTKTKDIQQEGAL